MILFVCFLFCFVLFRFVFYFILHVHVQKLPALTSFGLSQDFYQLIYQYLDFADHSLKKKENNNKPILIKNLSLIDCFNFSCGYVTYVSLFLNCSQFNLHIQAEYTCIHVIKYIDRCSFSASDKGTCTSILRK